MEKHSRGAAGPSVASEVLEQLVQHYSQEIHLVEEQVPSFDPLFGQRIEPLPSVISFWLGRLTKDQSCHNMLQFLSGYGSKIRICLKQQSVGCISILQHYEILLSELSNSSRSLTKDSMSASDGFILSKQINLLVSDIALMTSESKFPFSRYIRCNVAIPTILRIIHHCFSLITTQEGNFESLVDDQTLARCAASLLAFDTDRIVPATIAPMMFASKKRSFESLCACPPKSEIQDLFIKFLSLDLVDWSSVCIDGTAWNDHNLGVAIRSADVVWLDLGLVTQADGFHWTSFNDDFLKSPRLEKRKMRRQMLHSIGMDSVSEAMRSHFFGKDNLGGDTDSKELATYIIMGTKVTKPQTAIKEKPYKSLPSRVYSALNFVSYLPEEEKEGWVCSQNVIMNMLPVCLELVDSSDAAHLSLGTCGLVRLFALGSRLDRLPVLVDQSLQVLDLAFGANRDGRALILIGQAQTNLLLLSQKSDSLRQSLTKKWLTLLRQSVGGSGSEITPWEVLVGGVVPILYQLSQSVNADAIEVGRLGLSALLPLIGGSFVDHRILVASLVALINLMAGAYPMMVRHGGKIMSHVVVVASELKQNKHEEAQKLAALSLHTAAVALVIVSQGENAFGEEILDEIEQNSDTYQDPLLEAVTEVRRQAACLAV
eukprot:scaffold720_cov114-Cylindrotheca_fusiformis.AAC.9